MDREPTALWRGRSGVPVVDWAARLPAAYRADDQSQWAYGDDLLAGQWVHVAIDARAGQSEFGHSVGGYFNRLAGLRINRSRSEQVLSFDLPLVRGFFQEEMLWECRQTAGIPRRFIASGIPMPLS